VRASGGTAVAVPEAAIDATQRLAGAHGAGYVSPESAAALAAVGQLRKGGEVGDDDLVVVFDCGIGQKYPAAPGATEARVVALDEVETVDIAGLLA